MDPPKRNNIQENIKNNFIAYFKQNISVLIGNLFTTQPDVYVWVVWGIFFFWGGGLFLFGFVWVFCGFFIYCFGFVLGGFVFFGGGGRTALDT